MKLKLFKPPTAEQTSKEHKSADAACGCKWKVRSDKGGKVGISNEVKEWKLDGRIVRAGKFTIIEGVMSLCQPTAHF